MEVELMPISRADAKKQFDEYTQKLGLKHTFTFDEMYDCALELRRRKEFRTKIVNFENIVKSMPGSLGEDPFPLVHSFVNGLYIRQVTVPARTLTVTKIHAVEHAFFLLKGTISVLTENGVVRYTAPYQGVTKPGTKRIIWHHDEVIFTTVHATNKTDVQSVEEEVIAKDFSELGNEVDSTRVSEFIEMMSKEI